MITRECRRLPLNHNQNGPMLIRTSTYIAYIGSWMIASPLSNHASIWWCDRYISQCSGSVNSYNYYMYSTRILIVWNEMACFLVLKIFTFTKRWWVWSLRMSTIFCLYAYNIMTLSTHLTMSSERWTHKVGLGLPRYLYYPSIHCHFKKSCICCNT